MIVVKKGTIEESKIIVTLIAKLLDGFNQSGRNFNIDKEFLERSTKKLISRYNYAAFIAFDKTSNPVGLITIAEAFAIYNGGDFGVITELFVDERYRSKGIGRKLLDEAFKFSKSRNWKKVEVGAPNADDWPRTVGFYEKNGFKQGGPKLRIDI